MSTFQFIEVSQQDAVLVVHLRDVNTLDGLQLGALNDELTQVVEQEQPSHMIVGFKEVHLCTTTVVNSLLTVHRMLKDKDGQLRLCNMSENVRASFKILNLDGTVFNIFDTEADALEGFKP